MDRDRIAIGNWKMYKTSREAADYIEHLSKKIEGCVVRVYLAVPFTSIATASNAAKQSGILIGAQNMNDARDGAFTGEIAAMMPIEPILTGVEENTTGQTNPEKPEKIDARLVITIQSR